MKFPGNGAIAGMRDGWTAGLWQRALAILFAALACVPLHAAETGPPPLRDYAIDVWTSRNGLPHNSLRDIAQTPEGHLWFATWEGLVRYNGLDFTVFDRSTRPGLPDNGVGALLVTAMADCGSAIRAGT